MSVSIRRPRDLKPSAAAITAFVAFWGVVLALAIANHDDVPRGQAFIRAATVPLALGGLALIFAQLPVKHLVPKHFLGAAVALPASQAAYFVGGALIVELALAAVFAFSLFVARATGAQERIRQPPILVVLALVASEFTFQYVDYPVHRVGVIPASAIVLILRMTAAGLVLVGSTAAAIIAKRVGDRLSSRTITALVQVLVVCLQVAYFYIDLFTDPKIRFIHVAAVLVSAAGVAVLSNTRATPILQFGELTAAGMLGLVCLQFAFFYGLLR